MVGTIWAAVVPLVGVVIGGALSLLGQRIAERSAGRRHAATILESRRAERLTHLVAFLASVQEAERVAVYLHHHNASGDAWVDRTDAALDDLYTKLRPVQLLCSTSVAKAAHHLAALTHKAVREGPGPSGSFRKLLRPARKQLIEMAQRDLDRAPGEVPLVPDGGHDDEEVE